MGSITKLNLKDSSGSFMLDLRSIDEIGELKIGNNNIPFLHVKSITPPNLSEMGDVDYFVFVPASSFDYYCAATNWKELYQGDTGSNGEYSYATIRRAYEQSLAKYVKDIYDGTSDTYITNTNNRIFPDDMMYWLGYGRMSMNSDLHIEAEDLLDNSLELEDLYPDDVTDSDRIILRRDNVIMGDEPHIIDVLYNNSLTPSQNRVYGWMLEKLTGNMTNLFKDDTQVIDMSFLKYTGYTTIPTQSFLRCTSLRRVDFPKTISILGVKIFDGCTNLVIDDLNIPSLEGLVSKTRWNDSTRTTFEGTSIKKISNLGKITGIWSGSYNGLGQFQNQTLLTEVTLPPTIKSLGGNCFRGCTSLSVVNGMEYLQTIDHGAFYGCSRLVIEDLSLPNITTIHSSNTHPGGSDNTPFIGVTIKNVSNLGSLQVLASGSYNGQGLFHDQKQLTSVVLPDTLKQIGNKSFYGCTALTSINLPASITLIGRSAFESCPITIEDMYLPQLTCIFSDAVFPGGADNGPFWNGPKIKKISSLGSLEVISTASYNTQGIFENQTELTSVVLPNTLQHIGYKAFRGCTSLTSINLPTGLRAIHAEAFYNCPLVIESLNLPSLETLYSTIYSPNNSYGSPFYGVKIRAIANLGSIGVIAAVFNNVTGMFQDQVELTSVVLPSTLTAIGNNAFKGCVQLTSINIPETITHIGAGAFSGCTALEIDDLKLPNLETIYTTSWEPNTSLDHPFKNVTIKKISNLGSLAIMATFNGNSTGIFENQTSLTSVVLPDTVTHIARYAFRGCTSLASINLPTELQYISAGVFQGCTQLVFEDLNLTKLRAIYADVYSPNWATHSPFYGTKVKKISSLGMVKYLPHVNRGSNGLFENQTELTSVALPETIQSIGCKAFSGCTALATITNLDKVQGIDKASFYNCSAGALDELYLPNITYIYDTNVTPNSDHLSTFKGAKIIHITSLGSLEVISSPQRNGFGLFEAITTLQSVVLPDTLKKIGYRAFYGCTSLTSVQFDEALEIIYPGAFGLCSSLVIDDLNLPNLTALGWSTTGAGGYYSPFYVSEYEGGPKIKRISNLGSITELCKWYNNTFGSFERQDQLEFAELPSTLKTIRYKAFNGCSKLDTVILNSTSVPTLETLVFTDCPLNKGIFVLDSLVSSYKSATNWSAYASKIKPISSYCVGRELSYIQKKADAAGGITIEGFYSDVDFDSMEIKHSLLGGSNALYVSSPQIRNANYKYMVGNVDIFQANTNMGDVVTLIDGAKVYVTRYTSGTDTVAGNYEAEVTIDTTSLTDLTIAPNNSYSSTYKFMYLKLFSGSTLVRHIVPALVDDKIVLFDKVSRQSLGEWDASNYNYPEL